MYGQEKSNQQYIVNKKDKEINDQGPGSKKAQKNKWKKQKKHLREQAQLEEIYEVKETQKRSGMTQQEKQQQMVDDLKTMVGCSQSLIRQKLKQAKYNKELALNLILNKLQEGSGDMMQLFDNSDNNNSNNSRSNQRGASNNSNSNTNKTSKSSQHQVEQQAYKLLNDIYQKSQIQFSGFQFQALFDQITQIIKEDQKQKGRGLIEINNLVETCMTAKDAILVGLKDVFKVEDIDFDENDPVNIELQNFIYEDTQKLVQQQVINKEEFPTLGQQSKKKGTNTNKGSSNCYGSNGKMAYEPQKSSIVNVLQNQNKYMRGPITKQDLFKPSNQRPIQFVQKNSIFNVDNQQQSQDALRDLHKEYNHVPINTLKIVYLTLEKNFHQCRLFFDQYYPKNQLAEKRVEIVQSVSPARRQRQFQSNRVLNAFRRESIEEIDKELQRWTLGQLRAEIQHLYGLRQVFHMTCKNINNSNQKKQLIRIADQRAPLSLIQKLSKASRVKLIEQIMKTNPHYVDLHGYREEQVSLLLQGMIAAFRENFDRGNERIKYRSIGSRTEAIMQIMTGKGKHSQYGKSILKPCVKQWCDQHDLRAIVNEDNVEIFIPLN